MPSTTSPELYHIRIQHLSERNAESTNLRWLAQNLPGCAAFLWQLSQAARSSSLTFYPSWGDDV
jgi:hypothetical protein